MESLPPGIQGKAPKKTHGVFKHELDKVNLMRVVLFGLTGQGNAALRGLRAAGCRVEAVFTRKETGQFPHYREENIETLAERLRVPVFYDQDSMVSTDLLLVSTYHQKIPKSVIAQAKYAINLHPSLLPKYRGPTPVAWALKTGDSETGVTAHQLTDVIDWGAVYMQRKVEIRPGDTDGSLRWKLSHLVELMVPELVEGIEEGTLRPEPMPGEPTPMCPRIGGVVSA